MWRETAKEGGGHVELYSNLVVTIGNGCGADYARTTNEGVDMSAGCITLSSKCRNHRASCDMEAIHLFGEIFVGVDLRRPYRHQLLLGGGVLSVVPRGAITGGGQSR